MGAAVAVWKQDAQRPDRVHRDEVVIERAAGHHAGDATDKFVTLLLLVLPDEDRFGGGEDRWARAWQPVRYWADAESGKRRLPRTAQSYAKRTTSSPSHASQIAVNGAVDPLSSKS